MYSLRFFLAYFVISLSGSCWAAKISRLAMAFEGMFDPSPACLRTRWFNDKGTNIRSTMEDA